LSITTVYDPKSDLYLTDSILIFKEWIIDYLPNIDIFDDMPILDENYQLQRIVMYIQLLPYSDKSIGIGRSKGNGKKAKIYQVELMIKWITTDDLGGANSVRQLSQILKKNIDKNGHLLAQAGLRLPTCGGLTEVPKSSSSPFFGGKQLIIYRIESEW
jgi:hypothetical protein